MQLHRWWEAGNVLGVWPVEVSGIDTNPYFVRFHYGQHAGVGSVTGTSTLRSTSSSSFFFDGLSQGHWYSSRGVDTRWNVSVDDDLILSWQCP